MKQAVILCGGKGTRLGDLTRDIPKPLLPVGGEVLLDRTIELLERDGIERVLLIAGHLGEQIKERYQSGYLGGVEVTVFQEPEALGTAGGLVLAKDFLEDSFLLVYGDIFVDLSFARLREEHAKRREGGAVATLLVRPSDHPWDSHLVDSMMKDGSGNLSFIKKRVGCITTGVMWRFTGAKSRSLIISQGIVRATLGVMYFLPFSRVMGRLGCAS